MLETVGTGLAIRVWHAPGGPESVHLSESRAGVDVNFRTWSDVRDVVCGRRSEPGTYDAVC